jgi:DNA-binding MarR family transcriptional regulator
MMHLHKSIGAFAVAQQPSKAAVTAWTRLVRAQQALVAAIEGDLKQAGLPPLAWYDVLLELHRAPDGRLTPGALQDAILLAQYNLSRLLDRLEAEGLVRRVPYPGDKRRQWLEITEEGRGLRTRMWPAYAASLQRHVGAKLTSAQAQALADLLGLVVPPRAP